MDDLYSLVDEGQSKALLRQLETECAELHSYFGDRWWGINNRPFERLREKYEREIARRDGIWLGRAKVAFFSGQ